MKIGIVTLPLHTNYGGILQAYALQTILERMGHKAVVIDRSPYKKLSFFQKIKLYPRRIIWKLKRNENIFVEESHNKAYPIVSKFTQPFIDKYIARLEVNDFSTLPKNSFDAFVVGSDQVWRPMYYGKIEDAYLAFASSWDIKRLSYAPSFGTGDWEYSEKQAKQCSLLLAKFDAVSVREDSGVKLCKERFGVEAVHVLDPTFLLEAADYMRLVNSSSMLKSNGTLLNYILDETDEKKNLIDKVADEKALIPFRVNSKIESSRAQLEERVQPPVEQWLRGFYDADFVVTDSFHACVFSIIFNKPFLAVGNKARGLARFESLLRMFNLEDRLVSSVSDLNIEKLNNLNWTEVNSILETKRKESVDFLETHL
ncbi:polysaccharide pyruvyl transferase family protein [Pedobacter frigiditerrae]|uniref:polysaccharide pyruvyl transferase family protein n=1 Tax=Pedobacter frigiditerrae TaxID=2530452 RepID=UPI0029305C7A|nr:polysaccharide pyruvyl transferase family protein [Pedobacter frigiditerrae]